MELGNALGSTVGQRIPQVRFTMAGSAFSVSAEQPQLRIELSMLFDPVVAKQSTQLIRSLTRRNRLKGGAAIP